MWTQAGTGKMFSMQTRANDNVQDTKKTFFVILPYIWVRLIWDKKS